VGELGNASRIDCRTPRLTCADSPSVRELVYSFFARARAGVKSIFFVGAKKLVTAHPAYLVDIGID
jgi:hypothetical protein